MKNCTNRNCTNKTVLRKTVRRKNVHQVDQIISCYNLFVQNCSNIWHNENQIHPGDKNISGIQTARLVSLAPSVYGDLKTKRRELDKKKPTRSIVLGRILKNPLYLVVQNYPHLKHNKTLTPSRL